MLWNASEIKSIGFLVAHFTGTEGSGRQEIIIIIIIKRQIDRARRKEMKKKKSEKILFSVLRAAL